MFNRYIKKNFKDSIHILMVITVAIIVYKFIDNLDSTYYFISEKLTAVIVVFKPLFLAVVLAYILNPIVNWVEMHLKNLLNNKLKDKTNRLVSTILVYIILIGVIIWSMKYMLPRIIKSAADLIGIFPVFIQEHQDKIIGWFNKLYTNEVYDNLNIGSILEQNVNNILDTLGEILQKSFNNLLEKIIDFTSKILFIILSLIASFYILIDKSAFLRGGERFLRAVLEDETIDKMKQFGYEANKIFVKYVLGKSLDSLIIGIICFIGLTIMKSPYPMLISVIVGVTNMIPYFGPLIGEVVGFLFVAFSDPVKAFWILLFLLILQQFDSFILTPKILGNKMGINPLWIIFSIVLGGKLYGVIGMFLGVPAIAVIIFALKRYIDKKLNEKEQKKQEEDNT